MKIALGIAVVLLLLVAFRVVRRLQGKRDFATFEATMAEMQASGQTVHLLEPSDDLGMWTCLDPSEQQVLAHGVSRGGVLFRGVLNYRKIQRGKKISVDDLTVKRWP